VTDAQIFRRALGVGLVGVLLLLALVLFEKVSTSVPTPPGPSLDSFVAPVAPQLKRAKHKQLQLEPLTPELRARGYHECNPPDPLGLGPYSSYRTIAMGARMLIPQKGGHTPDMGYDVIVHFHGHEAARKMLVQVARGIVYVGLDEGLGSGPYADAFEAPGAFPRLLRSITAQLEDYSGDDHAHIRHLALSAWSAGYGAVNQILKHGHRAIDAVLLLDGLHAGWKPGRRHEQHADNASSAYIQPVFDFARRAAHGNGIFIFTYSKVDPVTYPSTTVTANLLLSELGLQLTQKDPGDQRFGMVGRVDVKGFHLWSYVGANEHAHCAHLQHLAPALAIIEGAWNTPAMDRDVPFHRAPKLGGGDSARADAGAPAPRANTTLDELQAAAGADGGAGALAQHGAEEPPADNGSFQPVLLRPGSAKKLADPGAHDPLGVSGPPSVSLAPPASAAPALAPPAPGAQP